MTADMVRFAWRVLVAVLIVGLVVAVAYAIHLILLVFASILLAVFLRTIGCWLSQSTRLPIHWCMAIVLIGFAAVMFGIVFAFGQQITEQASDVDLKATAASAASGLLRSIASIVLIAFLGLYLSTQPQLYTEAFF